MSEAAHAAAVVALLEAAGAVPMTIDDLDALSVPPPYYTEVHVMRRDNTAAPRRAGAPSQVTQWRVLTRAVAERYANAQECRRRTYVALHEATITVGSESFFIEHSTTDDPIAPDDGWFSGTSEFTY